ncbi:MAG: hypothetical protein WAK54_06065 [Bradyrhizobium sp.]
MKRLAHQGRANLGISTAGSLGVGCLPDVDLNLLEGLKCCNVVVTATKQRDDFFGEQRGCASSVRDVSAHRSQMRAAWIGNENTLCDQPRKRFGNNQLDGAFRSGRIGWPNDLEKRCGQGSRIEHAILQERWHNLDDNASEVFWCESQQVFGLWKKREECRNGHGDSFEIIAEFSIASLRDEAIDSFGHLPRHDNVRTEAYLYIITVRGVF